MIAALREIFDEMCKAYRHGSSLVLLFDYDGTLTPIVEHPRLAVLDRKTRRLLASLADRPRVHVGILSGRELDELRALVGCPGSIWPVREEWSWTCGHSIEYPRPIGQQAR